MEHRVLGQASLAEAFISPKVGGNARLRRIAELVDWSGFAALLSELHAGNIGRLSWPPRLMSAAYCCSHGMACPTRQPRRR